LTTTTQTRSARGTVAKSNGNGMQMAPQAPSYVVAASKATAADVKAMFEARLQAALEQHLASPTPEVAELQGWWDLVAIGPIQIPSVNGPYLPNDVIHAGEPAFMVTVLILNPTLVLNGQITASELLSTLGLPFEVTYQTGNITRWTQGPANLNVEHEGMSLVPHQSFYVDVLEFVPNDRDEVMYEMNISARIFGCGESYAPPFAGFAREIVDIDPSLFAPAPGLVGAPCRFLVYGDRPRIPA